MRIANKVVLRLVCPAEMAADNDETTITHMETEASEIFGGGRAGWHG